MYCDECQKNPANFHVTTIVNGSKVEKHLCETCAMKGANPFGMDLEKDFSFPNILGSILQGDSFPPFGGIKGQGPQCEQCGLTYNQFVQSGRLGCPKCYELFQERVDSLLRRVQGSTTHVGKLPKHSGGRIRYKLELARLKEQLKQYIAEEKFEEAAKLRDEIKDLEENYKGE